MRRGQRASAMVSIISPDSDTDDARCRDRFTRSLRGGTPVPQVRAERRGGYRVTGWRRGTTEPSASGVQAGRVVRRVAPIRDRTSVKRGSRDSRELTIGPGFNRTDYAVANGAGQSMRSPERESLEKTSSVPDRQRPTQTGCWRSRISSGKNFF
jgi:hypothetical protein